MAETTTTFQAPTTPTPNIVVVTNISLNTNEKVLREFFSFCGEIEELHLTPSDDSQKAIIRFTRESAARTALLLSNAYLGEKNIFVAPYFDDLPPYVNQEHPLDPNEKGPAEIRQEDKPKLSIVVELLANGYVLNDRIIDGAKSFDERYGVSHIFKQYLMTAQTKTAEIDEKYQISTRAKGVAHEIETTYHVSEKIQDVQKKAVEIDEKYKVSETIGQATSSAKKMAETAIASEAGQKVQGFLMDVWNRAILINEEARKKALEKEGQPPEMLNQEVKVELDDHVSEKKE